MNKEIPTFRFTVFETALCHIPISKPYSTGKLSIILDLTVVLNFAIDGVWINSLDDFGERFREKSVSQLL